MLCCFSTPANPMQGSAAKPRYRVGGCEATDVVAWGALTAAGFSHRDGERCRRPWANSRWLRPTACQRASLRPRAGAWALIMGCP